MIALTGFCIRLLEARFRVFGLFGHKIHPVGGREYQFFKNGCAPMPYCSSGLIFICMRLQRLSFLECEQLGSY